MSEARFQSTADLLDPWRDDVLSGKPPTLYPVGIGRACADRDRAGTGHSHRRGTGGRERPRLTMQMVARCPDARRRP